MKKICIRDKGFGHYSHYVPEGWGLTIDSFTYDEAGYVRSWDLCSNNDMEYCGSTIDDLMKILEFIKKQYKLEDDKDVLVIYTDNLVKAYWFLHNYGVTKLFTHYFQILNCIEIRACWQDDMTNAKDIASWASMMINNVFIPDKYFYLTPSQVVRRRTATLKKKYHDKTVKDLYPRSYDEFKNQRSGFFGGILYVPFPGKTIEDPMIEIDLKSAYIYCLLIEKHCMSLPKEVKAEEWEYYLDSLSKASIGKYKIKYSSYSNRIACYKNANGEKCAKGDDVEDTFIFTSVDLKIFLESVHVHGVECVYLYEYDMDYLPKYAQESLIKEYIAKEALPDSPQKAVQKVVVNSFFGETCRNWNNDEYVRDRKDPTMLPQWGTFCTAYCKRLLLGLATQLEGWYYSATDSIYCLDTPENRKKIAEYNAKTQEKIKAFCEKFGYDFEKLKLLGNFMLKKEITKFKAFCPNQYLYTCKDGKIVLKASGCEKRTTANLSIIEMEKLYLEDHVSAGHRHIPDHTTEKTSCVLSGVKYESNGSYFERELRGVYADIYMLLEAALRNL